MGLVTGRPASMLEGSLTQKEERGRTCCEARHLGLLVQHALLRAALLPGLTLTCVSLFCVLPSLRFMTEAIACLALKVFWLASVLFCMASRLRGRLCRQLKFSQQRSARLPLVTQRLLCCGKAAGSHVRAWAAVSGCLLGWLTSRGI